MNTAQLCQDCRAPLPPDAPDGLCPQCLLNAGFGSQAGTVHGASNQTTTPTIEQIAKKFPQFEIIELLGRGGMGIVYKAKQKQLDRVVALKILSPEISRDPAFAERFNREARALAKLNHGNIVSIFDSGDAGGLFYFVMEYMDGATLRETLQAKTISPRQALQIVPLICDALQYAHDMGVVHRDIKPENVLLDKRGRVKIADFGLAKLAHPDPVDLSLTATGSRMGTPKYMAPEQIEHPGEIDHRADIYSLGVVFYEMLTGELPVGRFALPSKSPEVDARLDDVVLRTLEQKPERRYQHASDVKSEVETINGYLDKLPAQIRNSIGFEYRSKASLFGLPLLHVTHGVDARDGKPRVAKGIFAFGPKARGIFACGANAIGVVAFGGFAVGVVSLGGFGIGIFSFSGFALGLLFGFGGLVVAPVAFGGCALGVYAMGGFANGLHANSYEAWQWLGGVKGVWRLVWVYWVVLGLCIIASIGMPVWARRRSDRAAQY